MSRTPKFVRIASSLILILKTRNVTFEERDNCRGEAIVTLRKVLDLETNPVFTQNFDFLNEQERYWSSRYTAERHKVLLEKAEIRRMQEEEAARQAQPVHFYYEPPSLQTPNLSQALSTIS